MIPWQLLECVKVPEDAGELCLFRRGDEFSIRVHNRELMNSRVHGSEEVLADLAYARLGSRAKLRVLVGGLGMGFTLAAALRGLGRDGRVTVAELVPGVVRWNRGPLAPLAGSPLQDPRVTVREIDVAEILRAGRPAYDVILLDVDNGPEALVGRDNDWLYARPGLEAAKACLQPRGVLAIWSSSAHPVFVHRLRRVGFAVEEMRVPARSSRGRRHVVWLAAPKAP